MTVFILIVVALGCGLFTDLYSFCLGDPHYGEVAKGRILSGLGQWLLTRYEHTEANIKARMACGMTQEECVNTHYVNWWKSTGVCPRCFCVWATAAGHVIAVLALGVSLWWLAALPLALGFGGLGLSLADMARQ